MQIAIRTGVACLTFLLLCNKNIFASANSCVSLFNESYKKTPNVTAEFESLPLRSKPAIARAFYNLGIENPIKALESYPQYLHLLSQPEQLAIALKYIDLKRTFFSIQLVGTGTAKFSRLTESDYYILFNALAKRSLIETLKSLQKFKNLNLFFFDIDKAATVVIDALLANPRELNAETANLIYVIFKNSRGPLIEVSEALARINSDIAINIKNLAALSYVEAPLFYALIAAQKPDVMTNILVHANTSYISNFLSTLIREIDFISQVNAQSFSKLLSAINVRVQIEKNAAVKKTISEKLNDLLLAFVHLNPDANFELVEQIGLRTQQVNLLRSRLSYFDTHNTGTPKKLYPKKSQQYHLPNIAQNSPYKELLNLGTREEIVRFILESDLSSLAKDYFIQISQSKRFEITTLGSVIYHGIHYYLRTQELPQNWQTTLLSRITGLDFEKINKYFYVADLNPLLERVLEIQDSLASPLFLGIEIPEIFYRDPNKLQSFILRLHISYENRVFQLSTLALDQNIPSDHIFYISILEILENEVN